MSDEECERAQRSYQARLEAILPSLPEALANLAAHISLHDGLIVRVVTNRRANELILELRIGDNQTGYFDLEITYSSVAWPLIDLDALARRARDRRTAILYDEIDFAGESLFEHRILFSPEDEICIRFAAMELQSIPRADRVVEFLGDPFVDEGPPARGRN